VNADLQLAVPPSHAKQSPADSTVDISIVIPVYNEIESLPVLHRMLSGALETLPQSVEIIFCDDGSKDGSGVALDELAATDARIRIVHLRRNYGRPPPSWRASNTAVARSSSPWMPTARMIRVTSPG